MYTRKVISLIFSLIVLSSLALASVQRNGTVNRQRVRENLVTLRLLRLTQALNLTEEQAAKIYPAINRLEREKLDIQRQMSADLADLRKFVGEQPPREAEIEIRNKRIREARALIRHKDLELDEFLGKNLTTVQQAKYLLFQIEFYRVLNDGLERIRMMRNKPPPPIKK